METFRFMLPVTLTTSDIDDIMVTAIDGGYSWFQDFTRTKGGWEIACEDLDADEPETYGRKFIPYHRLADIVGHWLLTNRVHTFAFDHEFAHTIDVNDADSIVQLAVYDEIVFA